MGFLDYMQKNLKDWHGNVTTTVASKMQDGASLAGDTGEDFVKGLLGHRNFSKGGGGLMLSNKRVPIHQTKKREIDFIIISNKKIHVIEVKNWSGRIVGRLADEQWTKVSYSGEQTYRNIVFDNADKVGTLLIFLQSIGYDVSQHQIEHKVFFVDTIRSDGSVRLELDKSIENSPNVITTPKLDFYLNVEQLNNTDATGLATRLAIQLADKLLEYILGEESAGRLTDGLLGRVGKEKHKKMLDDLKCLPTWDYIKVFGGDIIRGDVQKHYGKHDTEWKSMFLDSAGINISSIGRIKNSIVERNCQGITSKSMSFLRSMLMGNMPLVLHQSIREMIFGFHENLEKVPTNITRGNTMYNLRVRPAGNPADIEIPMPGIVEIQYGNRQAYLHWLFNIVIPRNEKER